MSPPPDGTPACIRHAALAHWTSLFVLIAKRAYCQLYNLSNFIAPGSGKIAFAIEANFFTCCYLLLNQEIVLSLAGCHDGKEQVICVFILEINNTTSLLTTWNKTIE